MVVALIYIGRKLQVLDMLADTADKLKHNVKIIADHLIKKYRFDPSDLQAYSPLQLTADGKAKIKKLGFDTIVAENQKEFFDFIGSENADTKYDVETAARKAVIYLFDKDYFDSIKSHLYNNPNVDERQLQTTLAVYLRDEYLKEHPEVS